MKRFLFNLEDAQFKTLKKIAYGMDISISELIRRAIKRLIALEPQNHGQR